MKRQLNLFFNSLLFYTRIRVPRSVKCNEQTLSDAFRYFPLVGVLVAGICAAVYAGLSLVLPREIATMGVMVASILLTGAFHEDGLADFFDGFGAGHDKESILRIMKDSHIGTYGVIALILALLLKFQLLMTLPEWAVIPALIAAAAVSRFWPVLIVRISTYSRQENSKSAHTKLGLSTLNLCLAALFSLPFAFLFSWVSALVILAAGLLFTLAFNAYCKRWIGGYTGDCLGALQQFSELIFYTVFLAIPNTLFVLPLA